MCKLCNRPACVNGLVAQSREPDIWLQLLGRFNCSGQYIIDGYRDMDTLKIYQTDDYEEAKRMALKDRQPKKKVCPVCGKPIVKHITKDGARYHVISYHQVGNSAIMRCSNPNCEINHRETCQYAGYIEEEK
jgi:hypothetical protein